MTINWYPGHMHKASKELRKILPGTRLIIEVLDARTPHASRNPSFDSFDTSIPRLKILNKADLADPATSAAWQQAIDLESGSRCLLSSPDAPVTREQIIKLANTLTKDGNSARKGQILIIGIPNVGKSTLINTLAGRKLAKTGNEPAVTRGQQRIKLDEFWFLVDTPGLLWPRLADQNGAYKLAMTGTIRNTALDIADIGWYATELLLAEHREELTARYQLPESCQDVESSLTHIARFRGALGRGGAPDWHKTAELLLNDFRSGKLGRISLETPSSTSSPSA
ncbi:MAG: ribosome biogenesis GTPase YlqF [Pseudohongiellaceae bacterium]